MKNDVVPVQIRGILPANAGCALFVGNDEKVFVILVEPNMGAVIGMFLRATPKERPLTHDLIQSIFKGFSINVERVVITELRNSTYFARLILQQQNELARKIVATSPLVHRVLKEELRVLSNAYPLNPEAYERIQALRREVYDSGDYQEGIRAFMERRPPQFEGV